MTRFEGALPPAAPAGSEAPQTSLLRSRRQIAISQPAPQGTRRNPSLRSLPVWIATVGGVGYAPIAPGTAGAAVAALFFVPLSALGWPLFLLTTAAVAALGIWAADLSEPAFGRKDDGRIVIDEVAGQFIALAPLLALRSRADWSAGDLQWWGWVVTGFVAFRVFDIWKPGPVGWAERYFEGGTGVMADDLFAGVFAALVLVGLLAGVSIITGDSSSSAGVSLLEEVSMLRVGGAA